MILIFLQLWIQLVISINKIEAWHEWQRYILAVEIQVVAGKNGINLKITMKWARLLIQNCSNDSE